MVKFSYSDQGEVTAVLDTFGSLNEPTNSIPPEIVALTGITDEMVSGQRIDPAAVSSFVASSNVVIAATRISIAGLPSAAGQSLTKRIGLARRKKLIGANMALTVLDWLIYCLGRVFFLPTV